MEVAKTTKKINIERLFRKILSGMVYFRVEILPEIREHVPIHNRVVLIFSIYLHISFTYWCYYLFQDEITNMENIIFIHIEESPPAYVSESKYVI